MDEVHFSAETIQVRQGRSERTSASLPRYCCAFLSDRGAFAQGGTAAVHTQCLDIQFQLVNLAAQRVAVNAQSLCSSHLIGIRLSQNRGQESPLEFPYRFGIPKAVSVHLQNESFELFLHGDLTAELDMCGKKFKGCDIGYALADCSREGANSVDARTVTAS